MIVQYACKCSWVFMSPLRNLNSNSLVSIYRYCLLPAELLSTACTGTAVPVTYQNFMVHLHTCPSQYRMMHACCIRDPARSGLQTVHFVFECS